MKWDLGRKEACDLQKIIISNNNSGNSHHSSTGSHLGSSINSSNCASSSNFGSSGSNSSNSSSSSSRQEAFTFRDHWGTVKKSKGETSYLNLNLCKISLVIFTERKQENSQNNSIPNCIFLT